jgi:hypothetical protein
MPNHPQASRFQRGRELPAARRDNRRRSAGHPARGIREDSRDFLERYVIRGGIEEWHCRTLTCEQIENKWPS